MKEYLRGWTDAMREKPPCACGGEGRTVVGIHLEPLQRFAVEAPNAAGELRPIYVSTEGGTFIVVRQPLPIEGNDG